MTEKDVEKILKKLGEQSLSERTLLIDDADYEGSPLITAGQAMLLDDPGNFEVDLLSRSKKKPFIAGSDSITPEGLFLGIIVGAGSAAFIALLIYLYKRKQVADIKFFSLEERRFVEVTKEEMRLLQPITDIDTGFVESTDRLKNELFTFLSKKSRGLTTETLSNFCKIAEFLVNAMHKDATERNLFRESADKWFEANKNKSNLRMEVDWFQPKLHEKLVERFGQAITREESDVLGHIDFKAYGIPIECKVLKDKDNYPNNTSGLAILQDHEQQIYQGMMHINCGFLICYDYRQKRVSPELLVQSVTERFQVKRYADKILMIIVFLGNMKKPSD